MQLLARTSAYIDYLATLDDIVAIGIGGSRASGNDLPSSDFDIYVLTRNRVSPALRRDWIERITDDIASAEIVIPHWGDEDAFLVDGIWHEFVWFDADWFFGEIDAAVHQHRPREGYSTSFVHTLANMVVLHDPDGLVAAWKHRVREYPEQLAQAIIAHNYSVGCQIHASYRYQISRAVDLNDPVSVNHRVAAFLACVMDIAFACLGMWHPGEKRQFQYLSQHANRLPPSFVAHINQVLRAATPDRMHDLPAAVERVVQDIEAIVDESATRQ